MPFNERVLYAKSVVPSNGKYLSPLSPPATNARATIVLYSLSRIGEPLSISSSAENRSRPSASVLVVVSFDRSRDLSRGRNQRSANAAFTARVR